MSSLFGDAVNLYRFRAKLLPEYQHAPWKLALLITGIGLAASGSFNELGSFLPGRVGFCIVYNWVETLLFALFMGLWLRIPPIRFIGPLTAVVVLSSSIQLLQPLVSWLPTDLAGYVLLVAMVYSILVMCNVFSRVSGMGRARVFAGILLFSLFSAFFMQSCWYLTSRMGWVAAPASSWNPFAQSFASDSQTRQDSSVDSSTSDQNATPLAVMP